MNQQNQIRKVLNRFGWDFGRYHPSLELLHHYGIELVVDVGANVGQFGKELRHFGYRGEILSYEPCSIPFKLLEQQCQGDARWHCMNLALGDRAGTHNIKVYSDTRFSSLRRLTSRVGLSFVDEAIQVQTLDAQFGVQPLFDRYSRRFLKIDTQGFEQQVLRGAAETLSQFIGVQMECSLTPLYEHQWYVEEAFAFMRGAGFTPWTVKRGYMEQHRQMEIDVIFFRADVLAGAKLG